MKKFVACMALTTLLLTGCGSKTPAPTTPSTTQTTTPAPTAPAETAPAQTAVPTPLEILTTVWEALPEDSRFPATGGDMGEELVEGPGALTLDNTEPLIYTLLVPEEKASNVKEAASLLHMMNANTFTCGVFRVEDISAADFGLAMKERILSNQWMCGFPDRLIIATFGDDTVLSMFGKEGTITPFLEQLTKAFGDHMTLVADSPIE